MSTDLIGIVTERDLVIRGYAQGMMPDEVVEHCMTEDIVTCREGAAVIEVGELMSEHQIRRILVVRDNRFSEIKGSQQQTQTPLLQMPQPPQLPNAELNRRFF